MNQDECFIEVRAEAWKYSGNCSSWHLDEDNMFVHISWQDGTQTFVPAARIHHINVRPITPTSE